MDTFLFDELLITHDIWGSEVLSQTSLNPRLANEMTHEQAGERSHPERRSVHTVAASPPDVTQKAFVTPIASFESVLLEVPFPSVEVTGTVLTAPFPAVSDIDSPTSRVSSERTLQNIPETLRHVTPTIVPATTSPCRCPESSPGVSSQPMMTRQQTMPSPICPAFTQVQDSPLDHPSSQITSSGPHSPTPLSASIAQANDPAAFAESLTASGQSTPPEYESGQPSMPTTESVIRSHDSSASCTRQTFTSVDSPASPRPLQQSPKPRTLSDVSPVPEVSHAPSEENGAAVMQSLLPTPISEPQSSDNAVSGSAWLWRGGAAAELAGHQPSSKDETSKAESSTSRQPTKFTSEQTKKSRTRSPLLITDTNRGIPIVIYDTDDDINEVANEDINEETKEKIKNKINRETEEAKTDVTALYETSRLREPKESRKRSLRKRVRGQGSTHECWVRPQYERSLLSRLRSAFYKHEHKWMCVRELPEAVGLAIIEAHNEFVQDFGEVCRANEAVFFKDVRALRTSFSAVSDRLLPMVHRGKDRDIILELGVLVDKMQDYACTLASIYAFRAGGDDSDDDTYCPHKKRRL